MKTKHYFLLLFCIVSLQTFSQFNNSQRLTISGTCTTYPDVIGQWSYGGTENGKAFYTKTQSAGGCEDLNTQSTCEAGIVTSTYKVAFNGTQWQLTISAVSQTTLNCEWAIFGGRCQPAESGKGGKNNKKNAQKSTVGTVIATNASTSGLVPPSGNWTSNEGGCSFSFSELAPQLFITEVSKPTTSNNEASFIEIFNNSNSAYDLSNAKIFQNTTSIDYVFDFGTDEETANTDAIVPAYGFLIVAAGATKSEFETDHNITLAANVNYNGGNSALDIATLGGAFSILTGGTADSSDGTIIVTEIGGGGSNPNLAYNPFNSGGSITITNPSPGTLEYLVYTNGGFLNSETLDTGTGAKDAYFYEDATISTNTSVNNLNTIGTLNIQSGKSLIVNGTASGTISYTRNLPTSNWYLIASPVVGQDIDTFVSSITGGLQTGTQSSNIGLGLSYNAANNTWTYLQSGASGTGNFNSGQGYSINLANASGDITFTGTMLTDNLTPFNLSTSGDGFNLIGNPYPSYVSLNSLLTDNTGSLDSQTVWVWDQEDEVYDTKVTASGFQIAPAQAVFVKSDGESGTIQINESYQSHQSTDSFQKTDRTEVVLNMTNGSTNRKATIYYTDNATTGFDNGYDGELFGGTSHNSAIYSTLVTDNVGKKYQIQSVPKTDMSSIIIPIGIIGKAGEVLDITADLINLPEGMVLKIEDKETNSFTSLSESNSKYSLTLTEDVNDIGRLYLHTKSSALSTIEESLNNTSVYQLDNTTLRVVGIHDIKADVKIYSLLGQEIISKSFKGVGLNDLPIQKVDTGVYIVEIKTSKNRFIKKILIN